MPPTTRRAASSRQGAIVDNAPSTTTSQNNAAPVRRSQRRKALGTISLSSNKNNRNDDTTSSALEAKKLKPAIKKTRPNPNSKNSNSNAKRVKESKGSMPPPPIVIAMKDTSSSNNNRDTTMTTETTESFSETMTMSTRTRTRTRSTTSIASNNQGQAQAQDSNPKDLQDADASSVADSNGVENKSKKGTRPSPLFDPNDLDFVIKAMSTKTPGQVSESTCTHSSSSSTPAMSNLDTTTSSDENSTSEPPLKKSTAGVVSVSVAPRRGARQRKPTKRYIDDVEEDEEKKENEEISEHKSAKARNGQKASTRSRARTRNSASSARTKRKSALSDSESEDEESDYEAPDEEMEEDEESEEEGGEESSRWKTEPPDSESEEDVDEEDWVEDEANSAWAKDAAMYDSALEEEEEDDSEIDDDSEDDESDGSRVGWNSIRHKTGKRRKQKGKGKNRTTRKTFAKRRRIRKDVKPIRELSNQEKYAVLHNITHEKVEMTLVRKFLQCLLFDFDYRYVLLSHQFVGAFGVAGIDVPALSHKITAMDETKQTLLISLEEGGQEYRRKICADLEFVKTKGVLLADDMGLGKTIQGLSGAVLRQGIQSIKSEVQEQQTPHSDKRKVIQKSMPTAIIGPNKDVLDQWEESLLMAGVSRARIKYFHPLDKQIERGDTFVLMTRYELFTEIRSFMDINESNLYGYPKLSVEFVKMLKNCYLAGQSKASNEWKKRDESESECVTRLLNQNARQIAKPMFRTILIDEAHFLKNLVSYWGIGTALLGMMSERTVPLSGTPYNNGPQDMATLMTFIDPSERSAYNYWWEQATCDGNATYVAMKVKEWRCKFLIRRDKSVLSVKLPPKIVEIHPVAARMGELQVYSYYESTFLKALKEFSKLHNVRTQAQRMRQKELFTVLMATMSCMRMCLIHPLVPGGREYTIRFSPSRRKMISQFAKESSETCVCCQLHLSQKVQQKSDGGDFASKKAESNVSEEEMAALSAVGAVTEDEQMQDADFDSSGTRKGHGKNNKRATKDMGKLVRLSSDHCRACRECPHYIHEDCLKNKLEEDESWSCPRCDDLESRLKVNQTSASDRPVYCKHIVCGGERGIRASAKIHEVVKWALALPKGDKAIMYSFFKGGLDILEGIFAEDLGIECARFDGDKTPEERSKELTRFKSSGTCRILLASVQSSGVGLNIVEANHVAFLDRWFNPSVHAQAEDRCHRLKQTKEVNVTYFDTSMTVDEVMASINHMKRNNASILLADGSDIGAGQSGIKYRDLGGIIGDMMKAVETGRKKFDTFSPDQVYEPIDEDVLIAASNQRDICKSKVKREQSFETQEKKIVGIKEDAIQKNVPKHTQEVTKVSLPSNFNAIRKNVPMQPQEVKKASTTTNVNEKKAGGNGQRANNASLVKETKKKGTGFLANLEKSLDGLSDDEEESLVSALPVYFNAIQKTVRESIPTHLQEVKMASASTNANATRNMVVEDLQGANNVTLVKEPKKKKGTGFLANLEKSLDGLSDDEEEEKSLGLPMVDTNPAAALIPSIAGTVPASSMASSFPETTPKAISLSKNPIFADTEPTVTPDSDEDSDDESIDLTQAF